MVPPRGFYVWTDDIRAAPGNWSDPVYFDTVGIDQDASHTHSEILPRELTVSCSLTTMTESTCPWRLCSPSQWCRKALPSACT